jgi:putative ABC transport system ATP-binding protein
VDEDWQKHLVGALGLTGLLDRRPSQVSVGQRQRVSIARALVAKPALLLLDEPVSALDPANVTQVEHLISILSQEAGAATLLASHQAQNGAFAEAPRGDHRVFEHAGVTYSVFNDAAGQQAHKSQAGQVA